MPTKDDMRWFKENFGEKINAALQGTPFTLDLMTALACQESGEIWAVLRKKDLSLDRILELCTGDTLDVPKRNAKAFPRNKEDLVAFPQGDQMFKVARQALLDMAEFIPGYEGPVANKNKFCHGFGIFQYDIQFFKKEPNYFLNREYADFDKCLARAIGELQNGRKTCGFQDKPSLTDEQLAFVAIAYNTGGFKAARGLKQGHSKVQRESVGFLRREDPSFIRIEDRGRRCQTGRDAPKLRTAF